MNRFGHFQFLTFFDFENIVSSISPERCLRFLGFDELIEICLFVLPFIDFLVDILETVSCKSARLFSFSRFFAAVLIFSPFATSCNTSKHYLPFVRKTPLERLVRNNSLSMCYLACYNILRNLND